MDRAREMLDDKLRDYDHAVRDVSEARKSLRQTKRHLKASLEAHDIVERFSREIQQQAHDRIASVVTKCLQIFDDPYEFRIKFERKRKQTEARLVLVRDGLEVDPLSGAGGGVVDVASFALRLACLILSRPAKRRIVILDEPFRHLSAEYAVRINSLLMELSDSLGIQFVMITHNRLLMCGKTVVIGEE